jgi:hypothetical protein
VLETLIHRPKAASGSANAHHRKGKVLGISSLCRGTFGQRFAEDFIFKALIAAGNLTSCPYYSGKRYPLMWMTA